MATTAIISILCPDRVGLVAAIAGQLFDLGANLEDTTFAVLCGGADFTSVCALPDGVSLETVDAELRALPELEDAKISVSRFDMDPDNGPSARITHHITVKGGDRPGLIARLCEVFIQFKANIVRLNSAITQGPDGGNYEIRIGVWIPEASVESCLATIVNTAGGLGMECRWREVSKPR